MIIPVGNLNQEAVVANMKRQAQVENITSSAKEKASGFVKASAAKKNKLRRALSRKLRERKIKQAGQGQFKKRPRR